MQNPINLINKLAVEETAQIAKAEEQVGKTMEKSAERADSILLEYQRKKEENRLERYKREQEKLEKMRNVHARPVSMLKFVDERIEEIKRKIDTGGNQMGVETDVVSPPSIRHLVTGETFLANTLGLQKDNDITYFVNDFILSTMDIEGLEDIPENYNKILDKTIERMNLTRDHKKDIILNRIYLYLTGYNRSDKDDLVVSIMRSKNRNKYKGVK